MDIRLSKLPAGRWRATSSLGSCDADTGDAAIAGLVRTVAAQIGHSPLNVGFRLMNCPVSFGSPKDLDCDETSVEAETRRWKKETRESVLRLLRTA